jgi:hypothetical protein
MKKGLLLLLILNVALIFSCKKSDSSSSTSTTSSATPVQVSGVWIRIINSQAFSLTFNTDNTYQAKQAGNVFETGTYAISGALVTINATGGSSTCVGLPAAKYNCVNANNSLTFSMVSDSCSGRAGVVVGTWTK